MEPLHILAGSSNGRTPDSESGNLGSSPGPAANEITPPNMGELFVIAVGQDANSFASVRAQTTERCAFSKMHRELVPRPILFNGVELSRRRALVPQQLRKTNQRI